VMIELIHSAIFAEFLSILLVFVALWIALLDKLEYSVITLGIFSLLCCIIYLLLDAPDVAMTEAALGACITSIIMLKVSSDLCSKRIVEKKNRLPALILSVSLGGLIIYAGMDLPVFGDINSPVHSHVMNYYNENTYTEIGISSIVAAILASYRGFDTFGETLVIFTGGICALFILGSLPHISKQESNQDAIQKMVARLAIPIIIIYGLYIQFNGTESPGGGFQAGAILASVFIASNISIGYNFSYQTLVKGSSFGVLLYMLPGLVALGAGFEFLNYNALGLGDISQKIGIEIIEIGICLTVSSIIIILYKSFFRDQR